MTKYDEQMKRWEAIIGDTAERTQEDALKAFFKHLKSNLQLPCEVTGTGDFRWEEPYVIGGWSQQEYERLKVTQPSYTDEYELLSIERGGRSKWMMFHEDNGTGRVERMLTWNGGNCCAYAMLNNVDDVDFTRSLLDDLAKVVNVDAKRVFATGISNGGIMSYRLASELSDRIAAIAPVAGTMGTATCNPKRPVPVMHFHGTDDEFLPFKGGKGKGLSQTDFYSVEHSITAWVKADGCPETAVVTDEPKQADDGTTVQRKTYGLGNDGAEVVLLVVNGGGHTWPGRDTIRFLGKSTHNIAANDLMWEFFRQHPMK